MTITKERKAELIGEFKQSEGDTGSAHIQIAVLTTRIEALTQHLRSHKKDHAGRRGLLMQVSRRRRLLDYLKVTNVTEYRAIIQKLGIRK